MLSWWKKSEPPPELKTIHEDRERLRAVMRKQLERLNQTVEAHEQLDQELHKALAKKPN